MAIEDIIADRHFEAAGIPKDDPKQEEQRNNEGTEAKENEVDPESGNASVNSEEQKTENNNEQAAAGKDSNSSGTDDKSKQDAKKEEEKPNRTEAELDAEGLLIAQNDKPVRAGIALRWMHQRNVARQEREAVNNSLVRTQNELQTAQKELEAYKSASTHLQGLTPTDVPGAVRLYSAMKQNPVATLKKLLVEAKAQGHNIDGIGEGVDVAAIQQMIDQKLNISEQNNNRQQQERQEPKTVENDSDLFFQAYPDAAIHEDVLAEMLTKNIFDFRAGKAPRVLGNVELYFTLKNAVVSQGLDFSKPITPQIEARKTAPKQEEKKQEQKQDGPGRVSGRAVSDMSEPLIETGGKDESYSDIIKRALAANPLN